jgi:hypothetical protein
MNLDYKEKYLKYKGKYLLTKAHQGGNHKLSQLFNSELFKTLSDIDLEKIIKLHYENEDEQKLIISKAKILKNFLIEFNSFENNLKNHQSKTAFILAIQRLILDIKIKEDSFSKQFDILSVDLKTNLLSSPEQILKKDLFEIFTQRKELKLKGKETIFDKMYEKSNDFIASKDFIASILFKNKLDYLVRCYIGKADKMPVLLQLPLKTIDLTEIELEKEKELEYGSKIKIRNKDTGKDEVMTVVEVNVDTVGVINNIYFHLYNLQLQNGGTLKDYFFQKTLSLLFNTMISSEVFIDIAKTFVIRKEEPIEFFLIK